MHIVSLARGAACAATPSAIMVAAFPATPQAGLFDVFNSWPTQEDEKGISFLPHLIASEDSDTLRLSPGKARFCA
jgi:hypothetical protein